MLLLPIPWVANASELGTLAVLSSLGQPFRAEIDLVSRQSELPTLSIRLASPDAYKNADLQYSPALAGSHFDVKKQPSGRTYLEVTSSHPVNDLFIDLLIELTWGPNRLVRAYTALIDLPDLGPAPVPSARFPVPDTQFASGAQNAVGRSTAAHGEEKPATLERKVSAQLLEGDRPKPGAADPGAGGTGETLIMLRRIQVLEEKSSLGAKVLAGLIGRIALLEDAAQRMRRILATRPAGTVAPREQAEGDPPVQRSDAAKPEVAAALVKDKDAVEARTSVDIKKEASKAIQPAAKAAPEKPEPTSKPRPSPESSPGRSNVSSQLYLAVAGGVVLLGGLAFWMWRRRKLREVTPEDILIKLLARNPERGDLRLKLLEIYFAREDGAAFNRAAVIFNELTGGQGEDWRKVAAMGYALDPGNPLYEAEKCEAFEATAANEVESPLASEQRVDQYSSSKQDLQSGEQPPAVTSSTRTDPAAGGT